MSDSNKPVRESSAAAPRPALFKAMAALTLLTLVVYAQVVSFDFVNFDDDAYITDNRIVKAGVTVAGARWAFTSTAASNWHPLTWFSHMLDCQIYGLAAGGHHATNVLLHIIAANLLLLFLFRATGNLWPAAFVAAGFALHPLHVESVAWVSERKDVLSALFWMLTMLAYLAYTREQGSGSRRAMRYLFVLALLALGLMAKPMLVTLPGVFLLLDAWPLARRQRPDATTPSIRFLIAEKIPMLLLVAVSCLITYRVQLEGGAIKSTAEFPLDIRFANAAIACVTYLWQTIYPANLAVFYPHLGDTVNFTAAWAAAVLLAAGTVLALIAYRRRPWAGTGWLWYLGTLVPVIGLVHIGSAAHADRYTYIPQIGILIIATWSVRRWLEGWPRIARALALAVVLLMAAGTWLQLQHWRNSATLFQHAVDCTTDNDLAHNSLAVALSGVDDEAAVFHYKEALRLNPNHTKAMISLSELCLRHDQVADAILLCERAVALDRHNMKAQYNYGVALAANGQLAEARERLELAVELDPHSANAHNYLGIVQARLKEYEAAEREFLKAIELEPRFNDAMRNLGLTFESQSRYENAVKWFGEALRINPGDDASRRLLKAAQANLQQQQEE
ncbi:MAG: tetratricopeptide repeat protein [Lentisphaeria bacterium]|nr:tetratricopeptide repeat protein [Lentisphaeria bacterium]